MLPSPPVQDKISRVLKMAADWLDEVSTYGEIYRSSTPWLSFVCHFWQSKELLSLPEPTNKRLLDERFWEIDLWLSDFSERNIHSCPNRRLDGRRLQEAFFAFD